MDTYNYVFYTIECLDNSVDFRYVGSTKNLKKRMYMHKNDCINERSEAYNTKKYKFIRDNGGWTNFKVVELGRREQISKRQAEQIEENYRQELDANMNTNRCYTTNEQKKEYYVNNKDKIKEYDKKYRENNKKKRNEYGKKYHQDNKDKINEKSKKYYENNKEKIKEYQQSYRENNKEKLKEYYENNKDTINEKNKERLPCECGCKVSYVNFARHRQSQNHINLIKNKIK